uniref:Uncharacterized protein n=1 Tax=Arundo donax TaxID=35708 RepID=A0A0A8ZMS8_ARUDO
MELSSTRTMLIFFLKKTVITPTLKRHFRSLLLDYCKPTDQLLVVVNNEVKCQICTMNPMPFIITA